MAAPCGAEISPDRPNKWLFSHDITTCAEQLVFHPCVQTLSSVTAQRFRRRGGAHVRRLSRYLTAKYLVEITNLRKGFLKISSVCLPVQTL